jgi:hypothetical protein
MQMRLSQLTSQTSNSSHSYLLLALTERSWHLPNYFSTPMSVFLKSLLGS